MKFSVFRQALKSGDLFRIGAYQFSWAYIDQGADAIDQGADVTVIFTPTPEITEAMHTKQPASQQGEMIAARKVVEAAEAYNREQGHENDGFLSTAYGFLPVEPPLLALPASHSAWDEMVDRLPELHRNLTMRRVFDQMPLLAATPDVLPDRYLLRASTMLGVFAHAYQYVETDPPTALPASILEPWKEVSRRLGKPLPYVSYADLRDVRATTGDSQEWMCDLTWFLSSADGLSIEIGLSSKLPILSTSI